MIDYNCPETTTPVKRTHPKPPLTLKPNEAIDYTEKAYEEMLDFELKESEARLEALNQELKNLDKPNPIKECPKSNHLMLSYKLGDEIKIEAFKHQPPSQPTQKHPQTIKNYTAALISFFSNIESEYIDTNGQTYTKKIPVFYASLEKLIAIEMEEYKTLTNGNTNMIPRASLVIDSMTYNNQRQLNKNNQHSSHISQNTLTSNPYSETLSNPAPYDISYRLHIVTRGMTDALMIAEQICSKFNPFLVINLLESPLGDKNELRVKLEGVTFEPPEHNEYSQNEVISEYSFIVYGNMFSQIHKEFLIDNIEVQWLC